MRKILIKVDRYADNGGYSHTDLVDKETGEIVYPGHADTTDLATDIDVVICMWITERKLGDIKWEDRCKLRELMYGLFMSEIAALNAVEPETQLTTTAAQKPV